MGVRLSIGVIDDAEATLRADVARVRSHTLIDDRVVAIRPDPKHVVSRGYACVKGTKWASIQNSPDRLLHPLKREGDRFVEVSWRDAIRGIAKKIAAIVEASGPQAFGHFVGSAGGKWGLLAPIFVPMLMSLGISPDLTQAAYRVGDSSTNIITPLMPYFPLVVVYCQRYVKNTGIGTLTAMMLPYSMWFLLTWTIFLLLYSAAGFPLGFAASYTYPPT